MLKTGRCPKCDNTALTVKLESIEIREPGASSGWNGVSYVCQSCNCILGVQIDPVALRTDIVNQTVDKLVKMLRR